MPFLRVLLCFQAPDALVCHCAARIEQPACATSAIAGSMCARRQKQCQIFLSSAENQLLADLH